MRPKLPASWAWCALSAAAIALPLWVGAPRTAIAQNKNQNKSSSARQVSKCVKYSQETTDDGVDIRLDSSCEMDLDCSVSWVLRCEGAKASKHRASAFPLLAGTAGAVSASSADCGDAGWAIRKVRWSCKAQ